MKTRKDLMRALATATGLEYDGGDDDNRLFYRDDCIDVFAEVMTKAEYAKMERDIESTAIEGDGYTVYAWNDASGFKYWSRGDGDSNYIQVTAHISNVRRVDPDALRRDMAEAFSALHHWHNVDAYYWHKMDEEERA